MKRVILSLVVASILVPFGVSASTYPEPPASGYYVLDTERKISETYEERINGLCREVELVAGVRMMVLTFSSADDASIKQYADGILEEWGEDGSGKTLVMVVSFDEHKVYTAVGDELEAPLAKSRISRIQEDILIPDFKQREYGKGIYRSFRLYAKEIADACDVEFESLEKTPYVNARDDDLEELADDAARIATCCACWHAFHGFHRHSHWRWRRHHCW